MSAQSKCPLSRGVRSVEVSAQSRCPLSRGVRSVEVAAVAHLDEPGAETRGDDGKHDEQQREQVEALLVEHVRELGDPAGQRLDDLALCLSLRVPHRLSATKCVRRRSVSRWNLKKKF